MDNKIKHYGKWTVSDAVTKIKEDVELSGESTNWKGEQDASIHYDRIKGSLLGHDIIPLDDMFGSWGKVTPEKVKSPQKEYTVTVNHSVTADSEEEARDRWAEGDYHDHCIIDVICKNDEADKREPIHVTYWTHGTCFKYKMSDGSSGSTQAESAYMFKTYWRNIMHDRELTFEDIT